MPEKIWPDITTRAAISPEQQLRSLLYEIALKHNVSISEIKGWSRKVYITTARNEFICRAVEMGFTRQKLGDYLGGRDSSTITNLYHDHKHHYL